MVSFAGHRQLDGGCGDGLLVERLAAQAEAVLDIDPDPGASPAPRFGSRRFPTRRSRPPTSKG
ncbi:MAG: hypothetical protein LBC97_13720 [Bifidobacteriaceae bacterium]|nr:hypothetical protein [Bifidobacteriaceae bacterium]